MDVNVKHCLLASGGISLARRREGEGEREGEGGAGPERKANVCLQNSLTSRFAAQHFTFLKASNGITFWL